MSRTKRKNWEDEKILRDKSSLYGSGLTTGGKMKPYATRRGKFKITTSTGNETSYHIVDKVTETAKLVRNNANRSLKKGKRQNLKKEMILEINDIF
jgi:hypothetical protein